MTQGNINFDFDNLIKQLQSQKADLKSLSTKDTGFGIENIAKDEGRKSSTGLFYFDFVSDGRAGFTVEQEEFVPYTTKTGQKGLRRKVLAWKSSPTAWQLAVTVGPSTPLRLREKINKKLKQELDSVVKEVLANKPIPSASDVKKINEILKGRALKIAKEITLAATKQKNTRRRFYRINAAISLAEGFRIKEK